MVSWDVRNKEISIAELEREMEKSTPQMCVSLSHRSPSVQMYYALRTKFERSSDTWMQEFLELDGLESLLDSLQQMSGKGFTSFSDAILQLDCISCIRVILNTSIGLDYMVQNAGSTKKLAKALDTGTTLPKKQVFEMLSAICAYSCLGYHMVMEALEALKVDAHQTHKFSLMVNEMRTSETIAHRTAILTFINCLISCTTDLMERTRIRSELIGLDILDVLSYLRKEEIDKDLHLQLEMFHLRKHEDEECLASEFSLDMNCPQDLLDNITARVFGSPRMVSFVNILQDLLSIELLYSRNSEKLWENVDNQVHQVIHLCKSQPSDSFPSDLKSLNAQINLNLNYVESCKLPVLQPDWDTKTKPASTGMDHNQNTLIEENQDEDTADSGTCTDIEFIDKDKSLYDNVLEKVIRDSEKILIERENNKKKYGNERKLKRKSVPQPQRKTKKFHWIKVTEETIVKCDNCIWLPAVEGRELQPNFTQLEDLFSDVFSKSSTELDEVVLLNQSTRLNLNLFLSRLELGPEELIHSLQESDLNLLTLPVLRYLHQVLPEEEEVEMLLSYEGQKHNLGMAEQFVLLLQQIPDYRMLLQGHLLKAEFVSCLSKLKSSLIAMVDSCKVILENPEVKEFLQLILNAGNFLNYGQFTGNAAGFKMSSLHRLLDLKSRVPNKTLLHFLVQLAMEMDQTLLLFVVELLPLEKATCFSMEDLKNTMCRLGVKLRAFTKQLTTSDPLIQDIFRPFLEDVKEDFAFIQSSNAELRILINKIAEYLCEERTAFNLQHCLESFHKFCRQIKKCQNENEMFSKQHNLAKTKNEQLRLHLRHKKLTLEFGQDAGASSSVLEEKNKILEKILNELHRGNYKPIIRSELNTPDKDINALDFSHISFIGSPMPMRPGSTSEVLEEFAVDTPVNHPKLLTSSERNLINSKRYSDVFLTTPKRPRLSLVPTGASMNSPLPKDQERVTPHKVSTHIRSRSDLTESIHIRDKWVRYEEICKQKVQLAPLSEPESTYTLSTLNLENRGKFVTHQELQRYESQAKLECQENMLSIHEGPILKIPDHILPESKISKKMEKRSSFGNFFHRISRAVLKPKNVYPCINQKEVGVLPGQRIGELKESEKENLPAKSTHASQKSQDKLCLKEHKLFRKRNKDQNGLLGK